MQFVFLSDFFFMYCAILNYLKNANFGGHVGHFSESGHQVDIFMGSRATRYITQTLDSYKEGKFQKPSI